ncbi:hypothetical protein MTO96_010473 [Rhipicephalus appendiculatus]
MLANAFVESEKEDTKNVVASARTCPTHPTGRERARRRQEDGGDAGSCLPSGPGQPLSLESSPPRSIVRHCRHDSQERVRTTPPFRSANVIDEVARLALR